MFNELNRCMKNRIPSRFENEFEYPDGIKKIPPEYTSIGNIHNFRRYNQYWKGPEKKQLF